MGIPFDCRPPGRPASLAILFYLDGSRVSAMPDLDAESLVDQVTMLGLVSREQLREAIGRRRGRLARCGTADAAPQGAAHELAGRAAQEGGPGGFFYGDCQGALPPRRGDLRAGLPGRAYRAGSRSRSRCSASGSPRSRDAVDRFHKEAEAGIRLRHDNIVRIIDVGRAGQAALHDHGVRRGDEPPRLPEAPRPDRAQQARAADARAWPRA